MRKPVFCLRKAKKYVYFYVENCELKAYFFMENFMAENENFEDENMDDEVEKRVEKENENSENTEENTEEASEEASGEQVSLSLPAGIVYE